jgi:hypothetical protein
MCGPVKWKTLCLIGYIVVCVVFAVYKGVLQWNYVETSRGAEWITTIVAVLFLVLWIDADSKGRTEICRPFEYGYLLLFLWLPYLPYYMWRTRRVRGLFAFVGLAVLFFAGDFVQLGLYAMR